MEFILSLALFGGFVYLAIIVGLFLFISFYAEYNTNGVPAFIFLLVLSAVIYFWGNDAVHSLAQFITWTGVGIYLAIGLIFSLIRTYFYGRRKGIYFEEEEIKFYTLNNLLSTEQLKLEIPERELIFQKLKAKEIAKQRTYRISDMKRRIKGNVARWWFNWPASLLYWMITEWLEDVWHWLFAKLKHIYDAVVIFGFDSITPKTK